MTIAVAPPMINYLGAVTKSLTLAIHRKLRPHEFVCERLEWIDIPEGLLHACTIPRENFQRVDPSLQKKGQNQEPMLFAFFKWLKRGNFVKRPTDLDLGTRHIQTDPVVLKALIFHFRFLVGSQYHNPGPRTVIADVGSITTGYITPAGLGKSFFPVDYRIEVTKKELEPILDGYPPWYSECLILASGNSIPHPIQYVEDVSRGRWIIAVGLSPTRPTEQECLMRGLPGETTYRPALTSAFRRVSHGLQNTQKAFPTNRLVGEALRLVDVMKPDETNKRKKSSRSKVHYTIRKSNIAREFHGIVKMISWVDGKVKGYASTLSNEQGMTAIEFFRRYENQLSVGVAEAKESILLVVLRAVVFPGYEIF